MSLLSLVIALVVVGIVLWALNAFVPMDATVKRILNIVVILVLVVWLLSAFGVLDAFSTVRVPRAR